MTDLLALLREVHAFLFSLRTRYTRIEESKELERKVIAAIAEHEAAPKPEKQAATHHPSLEEWRKFYHSEPNPGGKDLDLAAPQPEIYAIVCESEDRLSFVRLRYDGAVEYSGTPDEASKLFWDSLKRYILLKPVEMTPSGPRET